MKNLKQKLKLFPITVILFIVLSFFLLIYIGGCSPNIEENKQANIETVMLLPENSIPFFFQDLIFINIKVNDSINGNFIFDSGSDQLYLDSLFVAENNIPTHKRKKKKIRGVGSDTPNVPISNTIKLELDSLTKIYNNVPIINIRALSNKKIDGVLGADFFQNKVLKINFDSSYLQIIKPNEFIIPAGFDSLKLFLTENKTIINCGALIIDSLYIEGWTILDLGSAHALTFTSVIANEYKFNEIIKNKYSVPRKNAGYGGKSHSYYFRAENLKMANFTLEKPLLNYSTDKKGALSFWGILGLLGTKVLKRFDLIFDFPNKKLYLRPNSHFCEHFSSNMTGFYGKLFKSDTCEGYLIENVIENSSAHKAGILAGDIITHLNGLEISSFTSFERKNLFYQDTLELQFIIKRGNVIHNFKMIPQEIL
ncbi:MAG: aspartyl protease family protein [Bacteroidales bacterium]|nr:aspartyl protease family protein [Bacteroidales bacterium]